MMYAATPSVTLTRFSDLTSMSWSCASPKMPSTPTRLTTNRADSGKRHEAVMVLPRCCESGAATAQPCKRFTPASARVTSPSWRALPMTAMILRPSWLHGFRRSGLHRTGSSGAMRITSVAPPSGRSNGLDCRPGEELKARDLVRTGLALHSHRGPMRAWARLGSYGRPGPVPVTIGPRPSPAGPPSQAAPSARARGQCRRAEGASRPSARAQATASPRRCVPSFA
jgi:hypothetical protein